MKHPFHQQTFIEHLVILDARGEWEERLDSKMRQVSQYRKREPEGIECHCQCGKETQSSFPAAFPVFSLPRGELYDPCVLSEFGHIVSLPWHADDSRKANANDSHSLGEGMPVGEDYKGEALFKSESDLLRCAVS